MTNYGKAATTSSQKLSKGFTIVELLIVIVVIAILAVITIVSYTGIANRALSARLQTDISEASKKLAIERATTGVYPATKEAADSGKGLPKSQGTVYQYTVDNTGVPSFCLSATNPAYSGSYKVDSNNLTPVSGLCSGHVQSPVENTSNITASAMATTGVNTAYSGYVNVTSTGTGTPTPTVQWQRLPKNVTSGTWIDIPGQTSQNLSWAFGSLYGEGDVGYFRAVYTNTSGTTATSPTIVTFYYAGD